MSDFRIPEDLLYTREHEWARAGDGGEYTIGISDFAQDALGDITFVELPEEGREVAAGDEFGVVESVKTFSDLYAPVAGTIVAVNRAVEEEPSLINEACYEGGWLVRIRASDADTSALMDAAAYAAFMKSQG